MRPWYESLPERWQKEEEALQKAGLKFEIDADPAFEGVRKLIIEYPIKERVLNFTVIYPQLFPYFRPVVTAEDECFPKHQNPFGKNLCLLGRSTHYWTPDQTLADHLNEQVPLLLDSIEGKLNSPDDEEQQGEPVSEFLHYPASYRATINVDLVIPADVQHGEFFYSIGGKKNLIIIHAITFQIDGDLKKIGEISHGAKSGKWHRVSDLISHGRPTPNPEDANYLRSKSGGKQIGGFIFKENVTVANTKDSIVLIELPKLKKRQSKTSNYIRTHRATQETMSVRLPDNNLIKDTHVVVIGLGALGGQAAIEIAKLLPKKLTLVDFDFFDIAQSVRWPLGQSVAGINKADAIYEFLKQNYPAIEVVPLNNCRIGDVAIDKKVVQQHDSLLDSIGLANHVFSFTAEHGINHFLSRLCKEQVIKFSWAYAHNGIYGGVVGFQPINTASCYACFLGKMEDESFQSPPEKEGFVQPEGCAAQTFVGSNLENLQITSECIRLALQEETNPARTILVRTVNFVNDDLSFGRPEWADFEINGKEGCCI